MEEAILSVDCGYCGSSILRDSLSFRGAETRICVVCVRDFLESWHLDTQPPERSPEMRVALVESMVRANPDVAEYRLSLGLELKAVGRLAESLNEFLQAFELFSKVDAGGAYASIRQAAQLDRRYADLAAGFEETAKGLNDDQWNDFTEMLGSCGSAIDDDPLVARLEELAGTRMGEPSRTLCWRDPPDGLRQSSDSYFPGTRCDLCREDRRHHRLYKTDRTETVACLPCVRLAAEQIASGTAAS